MRGPELYGRPPENVRWSIDSKWIYFTWVEAGKDWRVQPSPFRVRATPGATPEHLTVAQMDSASPYVTQGTTAPNGHFMAVAANGDIYVVDKQTFTVRRLTNTLARETNPIFSADGTQVYYVRDNNVYAVTLATGLTTQITDIRTTPPPADSTDTLSRQQKRLAQQQRALFQAIRDTLYADSVSTTRQHAREALRPRPIYVGKDHDIVSIDISPTGHALLITLRTPDRGQKAEVPYYVTETGYTETRKIRTKVGDVSTRYNMLFVSLPNGQPMHLTLFPDDTLPHYVRFIGWNPLGTSAAFYAFSLDNKTRMLYTISSAGKLHTVERLRDTAWVDGPCSICAGWYNNGRRLWYVSEATGFAHLYTATPTGNDRKQLTSGHWEVRDVSLSDNGQEFYLLTNEPSPFEGQYYRLPINGGTPQRITTLSGGHAATISPNGQLVADIYSYVNKPPDLYVMQNRAGAPESQLTQSASAEWQRGPWIVPPIIMIPASDGVKVPAHLYSPEAMGAQPNGAAVIFVHGAGYLHNVGNFWSEYPRESMFNQFLAAHGYVVLDLDYRGSDGYGRDWRTAIYRWMGGRDLQDQVDASKYLTKTYDIPPSRIGIYGGSYGGFITLMALFTAQDYFGAGAALRAVTDWAHYNQGYTSNILNLPQNDTLAYHRSSPIYFADGLRAPLLMAHGMSDTNVHYQDIVRLTQRLIELGKTDWELASYPVESHAFVHPSSWTDEYTRIFSLFERVLISGSAEPQGEKTKGPGRR
jgi:dipeptidyl aminopeptidase/acylaminoacyl peptidase